MSSSELIAPCTCYSLIRAHICSSILCSFVLPPWLTWPAIVRSQVWSPNVLKCNYSKFTQNLDHPSPPIYLNLWKFCHTGSKWIFTPQCPWVPSIHHWPSAVHPEYISPWLVPPQSTLNEICTWLTTCPLHPFIPQSSGDWHPVLAPLCWLASLVSIYIIYLAIKFPELFMFPRVTKWRGMKCSWGEDFYRVLHNASCL